MDIDERNNKLKCSNLINMSTCFIQIIKCLYNNAPPLDAFTTFPWGTELEFHPDPNWPISPEPKVIDLDLNDEAIKGLREFILTSKDSD